MNLDPLLVGATAAFPNQNSSTAPTVWEEDTVQAAQQGIPCAPGPMLVMIKRSSDQQFLPGGGVNPAPETVPTCMAAANEHTTNAGTHLPSLAAIARGLTGGQFVGGASGSAGAGVVSAGDPGDGVWGLAIGAQRAGHGVAGFTTATSVSRAGVFGEARSGGVGVLGHCSEGSGIGVLGRGSRQAVRCEGGQFGLVSSGETGVDSTGTGAAGFGVVGRGTAVGTFGHGTGAGTTGVVGVGGAVGAFGRGTGAGTFGVVGVGGAVGVRGDGRGDTSGVGVQGIPGPFNGTFFPWAGSFLGGVFVGGTLFVQGNMQVTGSKAAVVAHPDGTSRALYAVESPDCWFEDIGRSSLREGRAWVEVDPDFAAVTGLGDDYHVFLTPEGHCRGLYIGRRTNTGFEVAEQGDGTSAISFSYRILTRRSDVDVARLEPIEMPTEDGEMASSRQAGGHPNSAPPMSADVPAPPVPADEPAGFDVSPAADKQSPPTGWPTEAVRWPFDVRSVINER